MTMNAEAEFSKGQEVEVSSNEEGFQGSWFTATIISPSLSNDNKFLVQYHNLLEENGVDPLEEYVQVSHLRPGQPKETTPTTVFKLNQKVDVYCNDGWWKGVIVKVLEESKYIVYFKTTDEEMSCHQSQLRLHLEYIDGKWVNTSQQHQETAARAPNEGTVQSRSTNIVTQIISSADMANFWEKVLSSSGNMCGWMGNEFDLGIMQQSTHEIVAEFSRSFLKVGEGETKALISEETSPVRGTSTGDHIDAEFSRSSEKVEEVEATKALMSVEKCHANGTSCGDHIDAEFSRSSEKVEEGEATKALMPVEKCHAEGTSSRDHIDAKFSRSFEKVGEGESTKVLMSIETCHARGISSEDHVDVEAQSVFSTYSEGKTVQYKNPVSSESFLSTSSDRYTENNQENVSKRKRGRPKGSGKKYNKKMPMAFGITLESQGG